MTLSIKFDPDPFGPSAGVLDIGSEILKTPGLWSACYRDQKLMEFYFDDINLGNHPDTPIELYYTLVSERNLFANGISHVITMCGYSEGYAQIQGDIVIVGVYNPQSWVKTRSLEVIYNENGDALGKIGEFSNTQIIEEIDRALKLVEADIYRILLD